jgi:hypothetical protein
LSAFPDGALKPAAMPQTVQSGVVGEWTAWSEGGVLPGPLPAGTLRVSEGDRRLL